MYADVGGPKKPAQQSLLIPNDNKVVYSDINTTDTAKLSKQKGMIVDYWMETTVRAC